MLHNSAIYCALGAPSIETGSYHSNARWTRGAEAYAAARLANERLAIVFGDAQHDSGWLFKWAVVDNLALDEAGTEVQFSNVRDLAGNRRVTALVKRSDGQRIDENVRRGYSVVETPSFLVWTPVPIEKRISKGDAVATHFYEGAIMEATVSRHERSRPAREACLAHHGRSCSACGMSFGSLYGAEFERIMHVHHVNPIAAQQARYKLDAKKDLVPLCPNCHVIAHAGRRKGAPRPVAEIERLLKQARATRSRTR